MMSHLWITCRGLHKNIKTHYEVLGVAETCSQHDIKEAFINLSKKLHPDKQPVPHTPAPRSSSSPHVAFVDLNTAYTTLIKPGTRAAYDATLYASRYRSLHRHSSDPAGGASYVHTDAPRERVVFYDDTIFRRDGEAAGSEGDTNSRSYYGSAWLGKRLPNSYILAGVVFFMLFGMVVQFSAAKFWTALSRSQIEERNRIISESYREVKEKAAQRSRLQQLTQLQEELAAGRRSPP